MHLTKILIIILIYFIQIITFALASEKFIYAKSKKDKRDFGVITLGSIVSIVIFSNLSMYLFCNR
ncbi:hypothetical protein ACFO6R_14780 [Eubacterium multiforme]|uniref:Uncharacterized protein n=1 Tax=Eubacterium multiforme TaxID=83339 RepID=A0ABT9UWK9_9FIRM|nr:hypothetical protein [Eubacterium multiforme]MDQ0150705.1 hypothetical protein [Eubacterium multiforme]